MWRLVGEVGRRAGTAQGMCPNTVGQLVIWAFVFLCAVPCCAQFESQAVDFQFCAPSGCQNYQLILSDFGVVPYDSTIQCASSRLLCS
jgi:hypothetical protein